MRDHTSADPLKVVFDQGFQVLTRAPDDARRTTAERVAVVWCADPVELAARVRVELDTAHALREVENKSAK